MLRACGDLWIRGWRASRGAQTDHRHRVGWKYAKCFSEVPRAAATNVKSLNHRGPFGFAQGRLRGAQGEPAQGKPVGAPLGRAAFLLAQIRAACAYEERTRDAQKVRGEYPLFLDGGAGGDFPADRVAGVDVVDHVTGTRASTYYDQRHSVSGRRNRRIGYSAGFMAVVPDRRGKRGGGGQSECDATTTRRVYRATSSQRGRVSGGNLLRRGFPTRRRYRSDGILGGSGDIADDNCRCADDTRYRAGEPRRDSAVRECGCGESGDRRRSGASGGNGDDLRHEAFCRASGTSSAGRSH